MNWLRLAAFGALLAVSSHASAALLYDNGSPVGDVNDSYHIGFDSDVGANFAVSNSFNLGSASTLTDVVGTFWVGNNATLSSLTWSIGSLEFTSDEFLPTVANSFTVLSSDISGAFDRYTVQFSLPSIALGPGTFFLTLENGTASDGGFVSWAESNGLSDAFQLNKDDETSTEINSESFQILGENDSEEAMVPEPATLVIWGVGAIGCAFAAARRRFAN